MAEIEQPECVTEDMLYYLDLLRDSGATNMFGAAPYVRKEFGLSKRDAQAVLSYWMKTFGERQERGEQ